MLLAALLLQAAASPMPGDEPGCDRIAIRYTPEREWSGVWTNDFEGSRFFEGATAVAGLPWRDRAIWFDDRGGAALDDTAYARGPYGKAYRIRLIGKAAVDAPPGRRCGFGHMGSSGSEIIATRVLSMEPLGDIR